MILMQMYIEHQWPSFPQWGQFLDHDITLTPEMELRCCRRDHKEKPECAPIYIPKRWSFAISVVFLATFDPDLEKAAIPWLCVQLQSFEEAEVYPVHQVDPGVQRWGRWARRFLYFLHCFLYIFLDCFLYIFFVLFSHCFLCIFFLHEKEKKQVLRSRAPLKRWTLGCANSRPARRENHAA